MKPMRILHIEMGRHMYGGALQVFYLLKGLKQYSYQSILVCAKGSAIAKQTHGLAKTYELPVKGEMDPRHFLWLVRIICREQPNVVHVHSRRGADLWGGLASKVTNTKAVITRRVDNPEYPLLARLKYSFFCKIVTISERIKDVLLAQGIQPNKIIRIYSGIDVEKYSAPCKQSWFCQEFSIPPDHLTIGMIAQFIPRKGHRYLIRAIPGILDKCPKVRFLLFGEGPLKDDIRGLCRETGVERYVVFAGFREDLHNILPCLDLVVHPATLEGLGVSLLQALASGVPIVGSMAGGIPEIVTHGVNGFLFDPADVKTMKDHIIDLLFDVYKRRSFSIKGKEIVTKKFSIQAMVNRYIQLYDESVS